MGVHSLWKLLSPSGRMVDIATLRGKLLAVDASIWLTQFIKAMRDDEGRMITNGHIVGTLRRICKLLYHRIRTVFVFDGGVPFLKRRIMERRRQRQAFDEVRRQRAARGLLANQLVLQQEAANQQQPQSEKLDPVTQYRRATRARFVDKDDDKVEEVIDIAKEEVQAVTKENVAIEAEEEDQPMSKKKKVKVVEDEEEEVSFSKKKKKNVVEEIEEELEDRPFSKKKKQGRRLVQSDDESEEQSTAIAQKSKTTLDDFDYTSSSGDEMIDDEDELFIDGTFDLAKLKSLPKQRQFQILVRLRNESHYHHGEAKREELFPVAGDPSSYSSVQLKHFLKGAKRRRDIVAAQKSLSTTKDAQKGAGSRIASDWTRQYKLVVDSTVKPSEETQQKTAPRQPIKRLESIDSKMGLFQRECVERLYDGMLETVSREECHRLLLANGFNVDAILSKFQQQRQEDQLIHRLHEGLGGRVDLETCRALLVSNDWKLEETLLAFIENDPSLEVKRDGKSFANHEEEIAIVDVKSSMESSLSKTTQDEEDEDGDGAFYYYDTEESEHSEVESTPNGINGSSDIASSMENGGRSTDAASVKSADQRIAEERVAVSTIKGAEVYEAADNSNQLVFKFNVKDITPESLSLFADVNLGNLQDVEWEKETNVNSSPLKASQEVEEDSIEWEEDDLTKSKEARVKDELVEDKGSVEWEEDVPMQAPQDLRRVVESFRASNEAIISSKEALSRAIGISEGFTSWASNAVKRAVKRHTGEDESSPHPTKQSLSSPRMTDSPRRADKLSPRKTESSPRMDRLHEEQSQLKNELRRASRDADQVTPEMRQDIMELLNLFGMPYIESPMEAEAQCAALETAGLVDGVVTDDSDAFLFGAKRVYKNIFADKKSVEAYDVHEIESQLGLTREDFISLALLMGSDYAQGIKGIGIVNAMEVLSAFPSGQQGLDKFKQWVHSGQLQANDKRARLDPGVSEDDPELTIRFKKSHSSMRRKWLIHDSFPEQRVFDAYLHPNVHSLSTTQLLEWKEPDVDGLYLFCKRKLNWPDERFEKEVLGPIRESLSTSVQTSMDQFVVRFEDKTRFAAIKSKRMAKAVQGMRSQQDDDSSIVAVDALGNVISISDRANDVVAVSSSEDDVLHKGDSSSFTASLSTDNASDSVSKRAGDAMDKAGKEANTENSEDSYKPKSESTKKKTPETKTKTKTADGKKKLTIKEMMQDSSSDEDDDDSSDSNGRDDKSVVILDVDDEFEEPLL